VLKLQGEHAEALALYEQALASLRSALGDAHPDTLTCVMNMANVLREQGKHAEALALYEQALSGLRSALGDAHPDTLRCMMNRRSCFGSKGSTPRRLRCTSGRGSSIGARRRSSCHAEVHDEHGGRA
jgi:tetratricopeptide (TPR) repeat protein